MTREEAIKILKAIRVYECYPKSASEETKEAIDMAIEALSVPQTDLISRADAIDAVLTYFIPRSHTGERGEHEEDFVRTIFKALPSADAVEHDGCKNCRYEQNTEYEYPCKDCKQNYKDKWEQKPRNTANWIPCSERLPKEKQEVYVTVYFIEGDAGRAYGYMDGFGKWHLYSTVEGTLNSGYEVTAWIPLPTSYKGGDDE